MKKSFSEIEQEFAHWLRYGEGTPPKAFDPKKITLYRNLVIGNIESLLGGFHPRLARLLGKAQFSSLIKRYIASKKAQTSYYHQMSGEFTSWLYESDLGWLQLDDKMQTIAKDLAHFDWLKNFLDTQEDPQDETLMRDIDQILASQSRKTSVHIMLSQEGAVASYSCTAQFKFPKCKTPVPTFLLLHRKALGEVRWHALSSGEARIVYKLQEVRENASSLNYKSLLKNLLPEIMGKKIPATFPVNNSEREIYKVLIETLDNTLRFLIKHKLLVMT